jgi:hypothetical protein
MTIPRTALHPNAALDRVKFSAEIIAANHEASAPFALF